MYGQVLAYSVVFRMIIFTTCPVFGDWTLSITNASLRSTLQTSFGRSPQQRFAVLYVVLMSFTMVFSPVVASMPGQQISVTG